jgi:hypothetical protein
MSKFWFPLTFPIILSSVLFCCAKSGVARGSVFYSNQIFLQLEIAIHTTGDFKKSEIAMHTTGDFKKSPNSLEI